MEDVTNRRLGPVRVAAVGLLTMAAVCLLGVFVLSVQADMKPVTPAATDGYSVQAVSATLGRNLHGLYLVDRENETICVYQYVPRERKLKLTAVRRYSFDARMSDEKRKETQAREP